jgi:peptidyl-tRNA hydrolase
VNHKKRKDFVLSSFAREEKEVLSCDLYPIAEEIIDLFCRGDIVKAMNKWNRRKKHGS